MDLQVVWFVLIAVLWIGFFVLEGFDFGVGMLLNMVGKTEAEKRAVLTTLGPVWDGNEVWLLVAGGATFAAFPEWYATLFSGFYLPLFLILVALILRGVAFEYRSKLGGKVWRRNWDRLITVSSFLPGLLFGVAFANIAKGVPLEVDANGASQYVGGFFNLLNPYALIGGVFITLVFLTHGAIFLSLKTSGTIHDRASALVFKLGALAAVFALIFLAWTQFAYSNNPGITLITILLVVVFWVSGLFFHRAGREGYAFISSSAAILFTVTSLFAGLYPNVMPSSLDPSSSLNITNASSSEYTLKVMTIVAVIMTPIVLIYQGWTYWVFRKRISAKQIVNAESGVLDGASK